MKTFWTKQQPFTREHWHSGLEDIRRTLADPRRLDRPAAELGMITHDIHRESREA